MNWIQLLEDNHIDYVTHGPNTRRGEVSVKCPWCGEDDPSQHLGIALEKKAWGCHRDASHRGVSPERLIQALVGCSQAQAKLIQKQYDGSDPDRLEIPDFGAIEPPARHGPDNTLKLYIEFREIKEIGSVRPFYDYLLKRGFNDPIDLAEQYNLRCAQIGRWKNRIIIPVYRDGDLIAWTARAITPTINAPRYLTTSGIIKTTIYNEDLCRHGGKLLIVTEGPFDALKVDYYGQEQDVIATCLFGVSVTTDQVSVLRRIAPKFDKVVFLMDQDATQAMFDCQDWIPNSEVGLLPEGVKDPGDLTQGQVRLIIAGYL